MISVHERVVHYDEGRKYIAYLAAGPRTGPLVILLHGWPGLATTWNPQIDMLASLGFFVVSPDMPGYGKSTANKVIADYSLEAIVHGLLALLADTGRLSAIWVAHDWGAAVLSAVAAVHPEVVRAAAWLAVPYGTLEFGYDNMLQFVNRDIYPEAEYPLGQWDYQAYYEEFFDKANAWFDKQIPQAVKLPYVRADPGMFGKPAPSSHVRKDGGRAGGVEFAPDIQLDTTVLTEKLYNELVEAFERTTWFGADAYYMNHSRNKEFVLTQRKNDGLLGMPCLFIQAKYDLICDTITTRWLEPMKEMCKNFSFANVDAAHWLGLERPAEVNAIIVKWLLQEVGDQWPGVLQNALVKARNPDVFYHPYTADEGHKVN